MRVRRALALLTCVAGVLLATGCSREKQAPPPPPPAEATARATGKTAPALCEHGVPAELCTRCTPELAEVFKATGDWCAEHGLPESHCKQCNPELTFTAAASAPSDWCKEHGVPESKCTKCHPALVAKFIEANDYCREHGFPESVCPICNPELPKAAGAEAPTFPAPGTKVRLASADTVGEVGLQTRIAELRPFSRTIEAVGQLDFNRNRHAELTARGGALVLDVKVDLGDEVKPGAPLVVLASAAVGADQAQLSAARARLTAAQSSFEREQGLAAKGISSQREVSEARSELAAAQSAYDAAQAALQAAGASVAGSGGRYTLTAPFAGTVVSRDAVVGRSAAPEQVLIGVADLSTMWAVLEISEADAFEVRAGQKVTLTFEGVRAAPVEATITRVASSVDPATRSVRARVELPNPGRALKAGAFLRAKLQVGDDRRALLVPPEAIQHAEGRAVVFVKREPSVFEPVAVELGARSDGAVEVLSGLKPGAEVVTTGAFLLKTELLKGSIGAGCCETGEE